MSEIPIELQLMRDMKPRSRPSRGVMYLGEPRASQILLSPGAAAVGMESMVVTLENAVRTLPTWCAMRVSFTIDGTGFLEPRPGWMTLDFSDIYSLVVHFPVLGNPGTHFGGQHTVFGRRV